jgi:predicted kinase
MYPFELLFSNNLRRYIKAGNDDLRQDAVMQQLFGAGADTRPHFGST